MTTALQVWVCTLQLAVRNTPQRSFKGTLFPTLTMFSVFYPLFFVYHIFHNLDLIFWHEEVMGKLSVVNQESDQQTFYVGHFGGSRRKSKTREVVSSRLSFHNGKTCTPTCLLAECSPPWCQRGRPRQGGEPAANWKQARGKWCMTASDCGF